MSSDSLTARERIGEQGVTSPATGGRALALIVIVVAAVRSAELQEQR